MAGPRGWECEGGEERVCEPKRGDELLPWNLARPPPPPAPPLPLAPFATDENLPQAHKSLPITRRFAREKYTRRRKVKQDATTRTG
jgi:hypothetical protein